MTSKVPPSFVPSDDLSSSSKNSVLQQSLSRFDPSPILVGQAFSLYDRVRVSGHAEPRWVASSRWNSETHTWEYQTVNRGGGEDEKWVSEVNLASDGAGPDAESISVRARTRFRRKWKAERFRRLEAEEHDRKATLVQQVQQGLNEMAVSCKSEAKGEKACGDEGCLWESYEDDGFVLVRKPGPEFGDIEEYRWPAEPAPWKGWAFGRGGT